MTEGDKAAAQLERLSRRWGAITEIPEQPRSTMDVIEYGLGKQRRAEVYVNRLLCYLLDPEESHGMGIDALECLLKNLPEATGFVEDTYDLSEVRVNEQVSITGEDSTGFADLVLDVPEEWFLLIELKFGAKETGTKFYADAMEIGDEPVENYESDSYYLYVHQHDKPEASSTEFANWTWKDFTADVLDTLLIEKSPRYPQRTAIQLHELKDDLKSITGMSEEETTAQQKVELYLEHVDAIEDVSASFDDAWGTYSTTWGSRLADQLDAKPSIGVDRHEGERHPEVLVSRTDGQAERWIFRANGKDWQHLFPYGWYNREGTRESLPDRAADGNDLRIGFYHRMGKNRDTAVREHTLRFNFRNMGSNPTEFRDIYANQFEARKDDIETELEDTNAALTGNKLTAITATYDIPVGRTEGFFEAYTAALQHAFTELIVENPALITILDETFESALSEYE